MTAVDLIASAQAEGLTLRLDPPNRLKLTGDPAAVERWTPILRKHKADLLAALQPPDPLTALYHRWLSGISEPRVLMTLDPAQVQEAVSCGAVSREVAQKSVLLLVKVPKGETGPGAVGLLSVPRDRWADFSPMAAVQALGEVH